MPLTTDEIREALKVCYDPELSVNIVDLGLVHNIAIQQDHEAPGFEPRYDIALDMLLRTHDDERQAMLAGQITNRLAGLRQISHSQVNFVTEPAWTADRMSAAARQQLGLDRAPKPGLVTIKI